MRDTADLQTLELPLAWDPSHGYLSFRRQRYNITTNLQNAERYMESV